MCYDDAVGVADAAVDGEFGGAIVAGPTDFVDAVGSVQGNDELLALADLN